MASARNVRASTRSRQARNGKSFSASGGHGSDMMRGEAASCRRPVARQLSGKRGYAAARVARLSREPSHAARRPGRSTRSCRRRAAATRARTTPCAPPSSRGASARRSERARRARCPAASPPPSASIVRSTMSAAFHRRPDEHVDAAGDLGLDALRARGFGGQRAVRRERPVDDGAAETCPAPPSPSARPRRSSSGTRAPDRPSRRAARRSARRARARSASCTVFCTMSRLAARLGVTFICASASR